MSESPTMRRFDAFELDTAAGELRRQGERVKLPPQPLRVLELLIRHGGEVVTRNNIRQRIWSDGARPSRDVSRLGLRAVEWRDPLFVRCLGLGGAELLDHLLAR